MRLIKVNIITQLIIHGKEISVCSCLINYLDMLLNAMAKIVQGTMIISMKSYFLSPFRFSLILTFDINISVLLHSMFLPFFFIDSDS